MSGTIGWGILGSGGIASGFVTDLNATGHTVVAVGSRSQDSADRFAAKHGIGKAHGSYEELVADPAVTVVYVATPHPYHAEQAMLALRAGKHVLVEKPFTINAEEAREVVDLAKSLGLVVLEAMWSRWLPHMMRLREILEAGTLGEVRTVIADHDQHLPSDPTHRLQDPHLGGGALLDLGIYPVSFAWQVFGKPSIVTAVSAPTATGVDRQTAIILTYADGQQALLHAALDTLGPNQAVVIGTEGRIEIDPVWYAATSFTVYDSSGAVIERFEQDVPSRGMQFEAAEMERLIEAGGTAGTILPAEESVEIMRTLDTIRAQIGLRYPSEA